MKRQLLAGMLLATVISLNGSAASDPAYTRLSRDLATPHTPFANPYGKGAIKALVVAPTWTQRETLELAQRLSLDFTPLMVDAYNRFGPYEGTNERDYASIAPEEFKADVDQKLSDRISYDLIIIGKIKWDAIPESVRNRLLEKIRQGAGLLYLGPNGEWEKDFTPALFSDETLAPQILRGLPPLKLLPRFQTGLETPAIRAGVLGRGRVVAIDYGESAAKGGVPAHRLNDVLESLTPYQSDDPLYYDYWHSLLARAAIWAANDEPAWQITGLPADVVTIQQDALAKTKITLNLTGARPSAEPYLIHYVIRDRNNHAEHVGMIPADSAAISLALPYLKGGEKVMDIWLRDSAARVVDWASVALLIQPAVKITRLDLDQDILQKGEALKGKVLLSQLPANGQTIMATTTDGFGRVIASAEIKATDPAGIPFALEIKNPLTSSFRLAIQVLAGPQIIDEAVSPFYINITEFAALTQDFTFHIWDGPKAKSRSTQTWLTGFPGLGIDTVYQVSALFDDEATSRQIVRVLAGANLKAAPYATRLVVNMESVAHGKSVEGPDGPIVPAERNPLGKSLTELKPSLKQLQRLAAIYGPFGPLYYSLGDENALSTPPYRDIDFSEQSQASFRKYVQGLYVKLEALNQEWGTDYKSWDEVKPITFANAAKLNRFPQWIDHRMHMDRLFTQYHAVCCEAIREIDPAAKIGVEGVVYPACSYTGFNLYELLPYFQYFTPYPHVPEIHTFSFLPSPSIRGTWFGSYEGNPIEYIIYMPWHTLFEGANSISWWCSGLGGASGLGGLRGFSPDLLPQPELRKTADQVQEIKAGIGKLLLSGERQLSAIGVYFANPCLHASTVRAVETTWEQSLQDVHYVLRDAGFDYRFVAPPQILANDLKPFKVIILPYSQAISRPEVDRLTTFVRDGGLLIADFVPGIMDEHGKLLEKSSLTEVFGEFTRLHTNVVGQGKAVCLADYIKGYSTQRNQGLNRGVLDGMTRLLGDLAGVTPFAVIKDDAGNTRQDIELSRFQNGAASYLTLLRLFAGKSSEGAAGAEGQSAAGSSGKNSPQVNLALLGSHYVYEVRGHADLGTQTALQTEMTPGQAKVYALLPAKVESLQLAADKPEYRPGELVSLKGAIQPAALNLCGMVASLQVDCDGQPLPHYAASIAYQGQFTHTLPLALNEKPGTYTVTVQDVVSGVSTRATFTVKP